LTKFDPYEWSVLTMNNPRRIQRHLVKALAAGALLAAAALPLAIATAAGAAPGALTVAFAPGTANAFGSGASGTAAITGTGFINDGGNVTITSSAPGLTFSSGAESDATHASADYASTSATVPGTYSITLTDDGGTATVTGAIVVNADPSYSSVSPAGLVDLATPTATTVTVTGAGFVSGATVTFTNVANGTTLASDASGFFVSGKAGTLTGTSNGTSTTNSTAVTLTGAPSTNVNGFTVTGTGVTAGTTVVSGGSTASLVLSQIASIPSGTTLTFATNQGSATGSGTSLAVSVDPTNSVTGGPATIGAYTVTVTNPDGGSVTTGSVFTISGNEISEVTPSAVALIAATTPITVTGSGFSSSATLTLAGCANVTLGSTGTVGGTTSITDTLIVSGAAVTAATNLECNLTVTNTSPGNGATYLATGAIGIGEPSLIAPTVTASSLSTAAAVLAGAPEQTITFTGTGFSQYTSPVSTKIGTSTTSDGSASIGTTAASCLGGQTGTTLTCELTVTTGAATGAHGVVLENTTAATTFPAAFSVAGPVITSAAPVALAVGAPVGTIVALTGTGFGPTTTGAITALSGTAPTGVFQNVSATQENFVVTSPVAFTSTDAITVSSVDAYGASSTSAAFPFAVQGAPSVTSTTYVTGTTGVGVGSKAQTITVNGSGFATGATIGSFVNAAAVADPAVTGTVTSVNAAGTQLTATIAVATGDVNTIDGFTITNTNGGTTKATAAPPAGLVIQAAPTITSVTPPTGKAASTSTFTVVGTGFQTGAVASLSPANGTCSTTVVSATSITAVCTLGSPGATPTYLVVTNANGGSATSTTAVLPATAPPVAGFHITGAHGSAKSGKTSTLTISGTGFYGQPKITSNAAGTRVGVSGDTGKLLTIHVTTKKGIAGEHTFTVTLANGKSAKVNYKIVK
jgi:hypothetical protein